jgi:hypothetical protein
VPIFLIEEIPVNNPIGEKYIELAFRYIAALYQRGLSSLQPSVTDKVKLESYQNPDPNVRRKYYIDKMYHSLAAATRSALTSCGLGAIKLAVRKFIGLNNNITRVLYYTSPLTKSMADIYARYLALICVIKTNEFANILVQKSEDLRPPKVFQAVQYTYYNGELEDFLRIPFKKISTTNRRMGRDLYRNLNTWSEFYRHHDYLLGDRKQVGAIQNEGYWSARKSLNVPLYISFPSGVDLRGNLVHIGHNTKTLSTLMFLVRLMNALELAGNTKMLGNKKLDAGMGATHYALSGLFSAPIFDMWMTVCPTYSHCRQFGVWFDDKREFTGFLFGDFPVAFSQSGIGNNPTDVFDYDASAKTLVRHPVIKDGLNTRDPETVKAWLAEVYGFSCKWINDIASNYLATFQYGHQAIEQGTDAESWVDRQKTGGYIGSSDHMSVKPQPEPFYLSYMAVTTDLMKTIAAEGAKDPQPIMTFTGRSSQTSIVKSAQDLFPNHLIRNLLLATNPKEVFGFDISLEPTDEDIQHISDFLVNNVSYVGVQYEPTLNMLASISDNLATGMDQTKAFNQIGLILRGYKRFNRLPAELVALQQQRVDDDILPIADSELEPSWIKAVRYSTSTLESLKHSGVLTLILDGKIEAAINLKNYRGVTQDAGSPVS